MNNAYSCLNMESCIPCMSFYKFYSCNCVFYCCGTCLAFQNIYTLLTFCDPRIGNLSLVANTTFCTVTSAGHGRIGSNAHNFACMAADLQCCPSVSTGKSETMSSFRASRASTKSSV
ncbi:hypothetical protein PoB_004371100 [Plakobranchus ocellatus]|uniref:Uncharacterized protein n=1 Tax=Plakobranchus ocellatus TaxID=259542 RepID=A0AAV4BEI8_9GAST|nr:hypothetical protein PoB_004371100 [Plakobranchus ocellatus]